MKVVYKMRFSSLTPYKDKKSGEDKYILKLLDDNDDPYLFFLSYDKATAYAHLKRYEEIEVTMNLFKNKSGTYDLYLNV